MFFIFLLFYIRKKRDGACQDAIMNAEVRKMDEFLRDIYMSVFKCWILNQQSDAYRTWIDPKDDTVIILETDYSHSEITFNPGNIIELNVQNTFNHRVEFYLHFQMKTLKHAKELFEEMIAVVKETVGKPVVNILLSCTGGMTTGFFAEKLNEASELLSLDYYFSATQYTNLFKNGDQYDVILLAPQISYTQAKVQEILKNQIVMTIPSKIFAKYDAGKMISLVNAALASDIHNITPSVQKLSLKTALHSKTKILSIAMIRNSRRIHLAYRLYDEKNHILLSREIIKYKMSLDDIYDIIDTVLKDYPDVGMTGLSMPGIMNDGKISLPSEGFAQTDVIRMLKSRYDMAFMLNNDVNCVAAGYYASQNQYDSLTFLFQPISAIAGAGHIYHGMLMTGRKNVAGEMQYLPIALSADRMVLNQTPEGTMELVAKMIVSIISVLGPEVIVLFCQLIPHITELREEIKKYIPEEYIPEIIKIESMDEYMLLGQMILCSLYLQEHHS